MIKRQDKNFLDKSRENKSRKFYSDEEIEELLNERIQTEKEKWEEENEEKLQKEQEKAERFASLPENERRQAELDENVKVFEDEKKQYMLEKMEFETAKLLSEEELPVSFARLLAGEDIKECRNNVNLFKEEFTKELEANLNSRLRGRTPMTNSIVENNDPFLAGFGN
ncbi:MAG: DUF4355 domain-containing protein [Firmicutes bacterium]|nr:DUF4355 domain-containing protein [Bacillota bacterium]